MTNQLYESDVAKAISYPLVVALGALFTWLATVRSGTIDSALAALLSILGGVSFLAFSLMYRRYLGILSAGGAPEGSPEHDSYGRLRASLARGGLAARLFIWRLTKFLDAIDHFFGDTGMVDRTLFPHAFGLKTPAPLWTAPAFDRCLFLTLIYPIATIFIFWTASGHAGPAETVLGLKMDVPGWSRGLIAVTSGIVGFAAWGLFRSEKQKSAIWKYAAFAAGTNAVAPVAAVIAASAVAGAATLSFVLGSSGVGAAAFSIAVAASVGSAGRVAGAVSVAVAIPVVFGLALALGGASTVIVVSVAGGVAAASLSVLLLCAVAIKRGRQGVFLFFFIAAMIVACFATVELMAPLRTWPYTGPLLLFQGLLTLVNTPFNWASVGLTRALLRRGLELGGWWPYLLALVDAIFAAIIVTLLALTMVVVIQAFDDFVVYSGGTPVLPLESLLDGIAKNPAAPQYWWIYALLLAGILPSLINLMIGGASLIPGVPGLPTLLLSFMPEGKAVPAFDRTWLSIILTLQIFLGVILGIAAEGFLAAGLIVYIMPAVGLGLLDQARAVASFDVPARVTQLFASFF